MHRKVYVTIKVRVVMQVPEGIEISEVMDEMDYDFTPSEAHDVSIEDMQMLDFEIVDSK